ncbi:hypothetical protein MCUN1_003605 [Malassezia cuniculi]|uniref:Major facilitator superfamily (MFS) profile domain-containing protein n=1 Tax=Malassezia cuniculi TaxID=948313 RepID=A0AAF0J7Y7_9BASI|nr:hypothetical protein MCUN1_003605 [Malassezia cuniculi]
MWSNRRRIVSLLGSTIVALSAGSTYVFSSYAPQVQERLHLSGMELNVLGVASNLGLYISGPLWGRFVDKNGPKGAILSGAVCTLLGYGLLSVTYSQRWVDVPLLLLALYMLLTGIGNQAALCGAINVQAKSWGGNNRGTAMAIVLSTFGLSAFMYSTVSRVFFDGNVGGYLAALAIGSSISFVIGSLMLRVVPPDEHALQEEWEGFDSAHDNADEESERPRPRRMRSSSELSGSAEAFSRENRDQTSSEDPFGEDTPYRNEVTGFALLQEVDFLLLFSLLGLISGAGLVLINNVGVITYALWDSAHRELAERSLEVLVKKDKLQQIQATQVSLISIGNASGRIIIGLLSDFIVSSTQDSSSRTILLILVALLALFSQVLAAWPDTITNVHRLLYVSGTTGLMYGTLFGLCPVLVFEWFGMDGFSQNWGWMSWGPVLAGNVFNLLFGYVYDSHVSSKSHSHTCHLGEECYRSVFVMTSLGCVLALIIAVVLVMRRANGVYARVQRALYGVFHGAFAYRPVLN